MGAKFVDGVLILAAVGAVTFMALSYFRPITASAPESPAVPSIDGTQLADISMLLEDGTVGSLSIRSNEPTIFLVFSVTCAYCEQNAGEWKTLADSVIGDARVIAVTASGSSASKTWLERHGISIDELVVATDANELARAWGVSGVPYTIVTDTAGTVEYAHLGLLASQGDMALQTVRSLRTPTS